MRSGCLYGNFTAEASDHSEILRQRLVEIFAEVQAAVAYCLRAAKAAGEVSPPSKILPGRDSFSALNLRAEHVFFHFMYI